MNRAYEQRLYSPELRQRHLRPKRSFLVIARRISDADIAIGSRCLMAATDSHLPWWRTQARVRRYARAEMRRPYHRRPIIASCRFHRYRSHALSVATIVVSDRPAQGAANAIVNRRFRWAAPHDIGISHRLLSSRLHEAGAASHAVMAALAGEMLSRARAPVARAALAASRRLSLRGG